jgi:hypothetical protein
MIDLTQEQKDEALRLTIERYKTDAPDRLREKSPDRPGGKEIRQVRDKSRGLLLLYPLKPLPKIFPPGTKPIIGMAISFPKSETAREITYTVNNVFTQQGGDDDSL